MMGVQGVGLGVNGLGFRGYSTDGMEHGNDYSVSRGQ